MCHLENTNMKIILSKPSKKGRSLNVNFRISIILKVNIFIRSACLLIEMLRIVTFDISMAFIQILHPYIRVFMDVRT
jgi:hypothetical protein